MKKYEDIPENYSIFESFLIQLSRLNQRDFPTIELMTVLKNEKPGIYMTLKKNSFKNIYLEFLTSVESDYEEAKGKLAKYKMNGK
jgi:hypothetical protein